LPFEPIDATTYQRLSAEVVGRRRTECFFEALQRYDGGELVEAGPAGCDSDKCLLPLAKPSDN
jgi:ribonucleotide reductase class II